MDGGKKRAKIAGQGSSSGVGSSSGLLPKKLEQLSAVEERDARLYRQDWAWEKFLDSRSAKVWDEDKNKALSTFNDKKLEIKLWKWKKVSNVSTSVPEWIVVERAVNVEEFREIGIVQMFKHLGWERVLDWCEDNTSRIYLSEVYEWLESLRFRNKDGPPEQWRLVGTASRGKTMSFETINSIARFDSLGVQAYDYPTTEQFFDIKANDHDPEGMVESVLPYNERGVAAKSHLTIEGKIIQGISL
ncbi:hypothetical protein Hanom_Chr07g00655531 [Helianthus anomalus]